METLDGIVSAEGPVAGSVAAELPENLDPEEANHGAYACSHMLMRPANSDPSNPVNPDEMLKQEDPIIMEMYEKFDRIAMPNLHLNPIEAAALMDYMDKETRRLAVLSASQHADISTNEFHPHAE